jgi:hypothetical protein
MAKIEKLTTTQETQLSEEIARWLRIGRSTERLDRPAATEAICAMYGAIGKPRPRVLFFSSPLMCLLARAALNGALANPDQMGDQLRGQMWGQMWGQMGGQLREQLWGQMGGQMGGQLRDQLWDQLRDQLWGQMGGQLWDQMGGQLWDQLGDQLNNYCAGAWWCAWEVFYDYCNSIGVNYTTEQRGKLSLWLEQSKQCHWWFPYEGIVFASERPTVIEVDARGSLHNGSGPALAYSDGYALYRARGVTVPEDVILHPESITVTRIESEANAEVRRVMIERYGWTRYIADCGADVVDTVAEGHQIKGLRGAKLLRKTLADEPEPIVYLLMQNSTPEPDGSIKTYAERIDPKCYSGDAAKSCHAAMASRWRYRDDEGALQLTFKDWRAYRPTSES